MDNPRIVRDSISSGWQVKPEADQPKAATESKLGAATFVVFALCLIVLMIMGTVKIGLMLFG